MELISRITIHRYEMGETGERSPSRAFDKSLAVFRVHGKSPERAMKILTAEIAKESDQVMVLAMTGNTLSEDEKRICTAAMEQGIRQSTKIVFCGGDPAQIFGRLSVESNALRWFPSAPSFISSYEIGGARQSASST